MPVENFTEVRDPLQVKLVLFDNRATRVGMLVGLQPELSARTGQEIKARSPFKNTVVMTMVNGAAKYMPDAGAFDKITYEAQGFRYAQGDAEKVAARIVEVLKDMQTQAK